MARLLTIGAMLILGSGVAAAQAQPRRAVPPRPPQIAGIAPANPAPPQRPHGSGYNPPYVNGGYGPGYGYGSGYATYGWVPAVVTADGRVFVDLGYGYEPVMRSCEVQYGGYVTTYDQGYSSPNYTPPTYTAPTYTPPTYTPPNYGGGQPAPDPGAQPAPGAAPAPLPNAQGSASPAPSSVSARLGRRAMPACWSADGHGRRFVYWH